MNELNQLQVFSAVVIAIFYVELKSKGDWVFVLLSLPSVCLLEKAQAGQVSPQIFALCFFASHCNRALTASASFSSALQASVLQIVNYLFRVYLLCTCYVACRYVFRLIKSTTQVSSHIFNSCFS